MRLLVTGGTGFLGKHLVPRLVAAGHEVRVLARQPEAIEGATVIQGDILSPETLPAAMHGCHAVIHAAGMVSHRAEDAELMTRVNLRGTEFVLEAAKNEGVRFFLHVSTSGTVAVSTTERLATEESAAPTDLIHRWPYYRSKYFAEKLVFEQAGNLRVASINPTLLLGPGDVHGSSNKSVQLFLEGRLPGIPSGGLSFVDVRDVADAIVLVLAKGKPGRRYLLGAANMSFNAFYGRLSRISGVDLPPMKMPKALRSVLPFLPTKNLDLPWWLGGELDRVELEMATHYWYLDNTRAREELGWQPRGIEETLRDAVADLLGDRFDASGV